MRWRAARREETRRGGCCAAPAGAVHGRVEREQLRGDEVLPARRVSSGGAPRAAPPALLFPIAGERAEERAHARRRSKGLPKVVSIQNVYSLINRSAFETDLAEVCSPRCDGARTLPLRPAAPGAPSSPVFPTTRRIRNCNVGLLAYSPLSGGALSGKYVDGNAPAGARFTLFQGYMARYNKSLPQEATKEYLAARRPRPCDQASPEQLRLRAAVAERDRRPRLTPAGWGEPPRRWRRSTGSRPWSWRWGSSRAGGSWRARSSARRAWRSSRRTLTPLRRGRRPRFLFSTRRATCFSAARGA